MVFSAAITVEDWSQGIRVALLRKKVERILPDAHYMSNRNDYKLLASLNF